MPRDNVVYYCSRRGPLGRSDNPTSGGPRINAVRERSGRRCRVGSHAGVDDMTTLPQTSPMRAPRVGGNGRLAMPIMHGPAPAASHAMTGADVWRVIRGNIWLILSTLVIAAIVGFLANMWLLARHSRYTAAGLLLVHTPNEMPSYAGSFAMGADPATLEIELRTHAKRLTHEALLASVLENSEEVRQ